MSTHRLASKVWWLVITDPDGSRRDDMTMTLRITLDSVDAGGSGGPIRVPNGDVRQTSDGGAACDDLMSFAYCEASSFSVSLVDGWPITTGWL
jgi:hypothetical protein